MHRRFWLALPVIAAWTVGCGAHLDELPPAACTGGDASAVLDQECFLFSVGPLSRDDADVQCAALNSHVAFVRNADENNAIAALIGDTDAYLGATDLADEGTFVWDDGSQLTFTDWKPGEPNNGGSNGYVENCMVMIGAKMGEWDDRPCAPDGLPAGVGAYGYVCER